MPKSVKINVVFFKEFGETNPIFHRFGIQTGINTLESTPVLKFAVDHKHYKFTMYGAILYPISSKKRIRKFFDMRRNTVLIFTFPVAIPQSYRKIFKFWLNGKKNIDFRHFPIILVGCTDPVAELLGTSSEPPITFEMGKQLARRMKAVKYLECLSSDETEVENIFEEVVSAWILHSEFKRKTWITDVRPFCISVVGSSDSGNLDFVRSFVFGNRMNVVGECMNEQTYFYDIASTQFDTYIEIDGEECELEICDWESFDELWILLLEPDSEAYIFIFSVVNPDSFYAITSNLDETILMNNDIFDRPVFLVGYQADLRNDAKIL